MDAYQHAQIHERMRSIPVASETACEEAYLEVDKLWKDGVINDDTPIETRLNLLVCLLEYVAQPTADALKKQIGIVRDIRAG